MTRNARYQPCPGDEKGNFILWMRPGHGSIHHKKITMQAVGLY
jgi:hypothetical protein